MFGNIFGEYIPYIYTLSAIPLPLSAPSRQFFLLLFPIHVPTRSVPPPALPPHRRHHAREEVGANLWALGEALQRGGHGFCRVKLSDEDDLEEVYSAVLGSGFNFDGIFKNLEPLEVWSLSDEQGWSIFQDFDHRRWDMEAIGLLRGMVMRSP